MSKLSLILVVLIGTMIAIFADLLIFHRIPHGITKKIEECPEGSIKYKNGYYDEMCIEVANSLQKKRRGLMHITEIPENYGMLFVFDEPHKAQFWMKNTHISLDIIFLNPSFCVNKVEHFTVPYSLEEISAENTQYVLEVNAGLSERYGFVEGSCEQPLPKEILELNF